MPTRANALAVMAKAPIPGTVKTRLVPPLSDEQACELYCALLLDQLDNLTGLSEIDLYLAYSPAHAAPLIENLSPPGIGALAMTASALARVGIEMFQARRRDAGQIE